ncbi:hypothetical protein SAMN02745702_00560 [Desulfobaculum bizertense DSM 18034]|uniref:Uncharacterized protein n=1 Tax=Desulfobaculum bizertense DSM 18034 TaxID=1121442 RepID=A0A1T4VKS5_9BACT|nr:hypothetical protein SAMN02745702_00560 [Desulfobaculum bizertense DSM 18034]
MQRQVVAINFKKSQNETSLGKTPRKACSKSCEVCAKCIGQQQILQQGCVRVFRDVVLRKCCESVLVFLCTVSWLSCTLCRSGILFVLRCFDACGLKLGKAFEWQGFFFFQSLVCVECYFHIACLFCGKGGTQEHLIFK